MPTHTQATVEAWGGTQTGGMGHRNDENLKAIFPNSPLPGFLDIYTTTVVSDACIAAFNGNGGDGDTVNDMPLASDGTINDRGHMFGTFNLNYLGEGGAPDVEGVEGGGGGLPALPYVPNLASPGPGSTSYTDQPEYTGVLPEGGGEYGVGLGYTANPLKTSQGVSGQTLGDYVQGRSYVGSDGTT